MCHFYPFSYIHHFPMDTFLQGTKLFDGKMKGDIARIHSFKKQNNK